MSDPVQETGRQLGMVFARNRALVGLSLWVTADGQLHYHIRLDPSRQHGVPLRNIAEAACEQIGPMLVEIAK